MRLQRVLFIFLTVVIFSCKNEVEINSISNSGETNNITSQIDEYIKNIMEVDEIPGIAIAVMQDSTVLHKNYYGYANISHKVKVSDSSVFRAYSLTKFMTAVAVFRLIEEHKLNLKDPIAKYIDDLPQDWKQIRIEHLLTHSSGLPEYKDLDQSLSDKDILKKLKSEPLRYKAGERYEYNQTGFWFLKQMIEQATGISYENTMLNLQFANAGNEVFFASNSLATYPNRNAKYIYNHQLKRYENSTFSAGNRSLAGNGLNTNLNQLIKWNKRFDDGSLVTTETKSELLKPFTYAKDRKRFLHGIDIYPVNNHSMYGFSGGAVVDFKKFDTGLTVIILTNGFKYRPRIATMMRYIAGIADNKLKETNIMVQERLRIAMMKSVKKGTQSQVYKEAKKKYSQVTFEATLNNLGYDYILADELSDAIKILKLNTIEHPNSFNVFDSLGEAYMLNGDTELSIKNYKKSIELNPENNNAIQMIKKMINNKSKK